MRHALVLVAALVHANVAPAQAAARDEPFVQVLTRAGTVVQGRLATKALAVTIDGASTDLAIADVLSLHLAAAPSAHEDERIAADLGALGDQDVAKARAAAEELADIGLPAITPLLRSFADTDAHEPDPRYRLFARLVPGRADCKDRTLDLLRRRDGRVQRCRWTTCDLALRDAAGERTVVAAGDVRRVAVRQDKVVHTFELQALHHCTYVGWLDSGIAVGPDSRLTADAEGYVRLSFDEDGWASDPDGIVDPLPGKRRLQEGYRWGAVLACVGAAGERWLVGKHVERGGLPAGRLYSVVNDNDHWQNNIGSYRVTVTATNAFDLGDPQ
jgi:hypothetical protein